MIDFESIYGNENLRRIIDILPGLSDFMRNEDPFDFDCIMSKYEARLKESGRRTWGVIANINLLKRKYKEQLEFNGIKAPDSDEKDRIIPAWEDLVSFHEKEHLRALLCQLPGISTYLLKYKDNPNLTDIISIYEKENEIEIKSNKTLRFVTVSVKSYFQKAIDYNRFALHFVSTMYCIDDTQLVQDFFTDARNNFFTKDLTKDDCQQFISRYIHSYHPYIDSEIGSHYLKYGHYKIAFVFFSHVLRYAFSCPNIYWNNKEAIFGCATTVEGIVKILIDSGISVESSLKESVLFPLVELCYLLSSRIVYWNDKTPIDQLVYKDDALPIRVQDKIHFLTTRVNLLNTFPFVFVNSGSSVSEINQMKYADLYEMHKIAYNAKIVGEESVYIQQCKELLQSSVEEGLPSPAYTMGKEIADMLAWQYYKNYKKGKYCLRWESLRNMLPSMADNVPYLSNTIPDLLKIVRDTNYEVSYKKDRREIHDYLSSHGIKCFYHFTERSKLSSIIKQGGLLSYKKCLELGIVIPSTKDMSVSRDIDASFKLDDYVRVSFCRYLPKIDERKMEDKDFVLLRISPEVAEFKNTLFTDMEATRPEHHHGPTFDDLRMVNIQSTRKLFCSDKDPDYWYHQAEVMIKEKLPLKFILNIDNPENL